MTRTPAPRTVSSFRNGASARTSSAGRLPGDAPLSSDLMAAAAGWVKTAGGGIPPTGSTAGSFQSGAMDDENSELPPVRSGSPISSGLNSMGGGSGVPTAAIDTARLGATLEAASTRYLRVDMRVSVWRRQCGDDAMPDFAIASLQNAAQQCERPDKPKCSK